MTKIMLGDLEIRLEIEWVNPSLIKETFGLDFTMPWFRSGIIYYKFDKEIIAKIKYKPKSRVIGQILIQNKEKIFEIIYKDYVKKYGNILSIVYLDGGVVTYKVNNIAMPEMHKYSRYSSNRIIAYGLLHDDKFIKKWSIDLNKVALVIYNNEIIINRLRKILGDKDE